MRVGNNEGRVWGVFRFMFVLQLGYEIWICLGLGTYFSSYNLTEDAQRSKVVSDWAMTSGWISSLSPPTKQSIKTSVARPVKHNQFDAV